MINSIESLYENQSRQSQLSSMSQLDYQIYLENYRNSLLLGSKTSQAISSQMNTKNEVDSNDKLLLLIEDLTNET